MMGRFSPKDMRHSHKLKMNWCLNLAMQQDGDWHG